MQSRPVLLEFPFGTVILSPLRRSTTAGSTLPPVIGRYTAFKAHALSIIACLTFKERP